MATMRAGLIAAGLLAAGPVLAAPADFPACDGYPAPTRKADGMTSSNVMLGLMTVNSDVRKNTRIGVGADGARACEAALADPALLPAHQLRRANLWQAHAIHLLGAGDLAGAVESAARSDGIGTELGGDLFADSVGLGNRAIRVLALRGLNRGAEAAAEVSAIQARRPFSPSIRTLAWLLYVNADPDFTVERRETRAQAGVNPALIEKSFWNAVILGEFAEALALGANVEFDIPKARGGWVVEGDSRYDLIWERAKFGGALAYAALASGDEARAATIMASAREEIEAAIAPPPPPPPGKTILPAKRKDFEQRKSAGAKAAQMLDQWDWGMRTRREIASMTPEEAIAALETGPLDQLPIGVDLFRRIKAPPAEQAEFDTVIRDLDQQSREARRNFVTVYPGDLMTLIPRPEAAAMKPRFRKVDWIFSDNGFSHRKIDGSDATTVRFTHHLASGPMVEELALLSAAQLAQREGKDGLLVLVSRTLQRTTRQYGYMNIGYTDIPSGYEAQMNVVFVTRSAMPAEYRGAEWRVLAVSDILAQLGPKYLPQAPGGSASRERPDQNRTAAVALMLWMRKFASLRRKSVPSGFASRNRLVGAAPPGPARMRYSSSSYVLNR